MVNGGNNDIEEGQKRTKSKTIPQSTTAHLQFRTEIKQEPSPIPEISIRQMASTNSTISDPMKNARLPSLRIAPFAREKMINGNDALEIRLTKQKPDLMQQASKMHNLRIANVQTTSDFLPNKKQQQAIVNKQQTTAQITRFPKEIMVPPRMSTTNTAQLRLKHTPMRKSAQYTLRPERNVTEMNRDANISLPDFGSYHNYSSSNDYSNHLKYANKLRQQSFATNSTTSIGTAKKKRFSNYDEWNNTASNMSNRRKVLDEQQEDDTDSESDYDASENNSQKNESNTCRMDKALFSNIMKEFSNTVRDMQRDMITNFFNNQMMLSRKEHEFQIKQDMLIMESLKSQSQQYYEMARNYGELKANCKCNKTTKEQSCQTNEEDYQTKTEKSHIDKVPINENNKNYSEIDNNDNDIGDNDDDEDDDDEDDENDDDDDDDDTSTINSSSYNHNNNESLNKVPRINITI